MYIAFLRSINVGKKNKISMSELSELFKKNEFKNIKTHLNTGNVIFDSDLDDKKKLEDQISASILEDLQLEIEVIVRDKEEIEDILSSYNFDSLDGKNRYVTLLKKSIGKNLKVTMDEEIESYKKDDDLYEVLENHISLYIPSGYGTTKINNKFIEKKSKVFATTRNINTLEKILKLMS